MPLADRVNLPIVSVVFNRTLPLSTVPLRNGRTTQSYADTANVQVKTNLSPGQNCGLDVTPFD